MPGIAVIEFASAAEAERRIAGVAAVGRAVRKLTEDGYSDCWLALPGGAALGAAAADDVRRLSGAMAVHIGEPDGKSDVTRVGGAALVPTAAEVLRQTGKRRDGPVSRWINRPISRRLSALLLLLPGFRPIHATIGTALLAAAMFAALVAGGAPGLIAGALLYQAASIFDGVDGEVARATFRSSHFGATLDTSIDVATNFLFVAGLALNLFVAGDARAATLAEWGLALNLLGLALVSWRNRRRGGAVDLEGVKDHYRGRFDHPAIARAMALATMVTSRDFFALLFMILVLAGYGLAVLYIFAAAASVWILFVIGSLIGASPARPVRDRA